MNAKQRILQAFAGTALAQRYLRDTHDRAVCLATFSLCLNLAYALGHGAIGLWRRSLWLLALCAYYTILAAMRFAVVLCARKKAREAIGLFAASVCGWLLLFLSSVLGGITYLSIAENIATRHDTILMITIALYTFIKITLAVMRFIKWRGDPSPLLAALRSIGYADVAVSAFSLQRSMLVSFGDMPFVDIRAMNIATATAVWLFILFLGIQLIVRQK